MWNSSLISYQRKHAPLAPTSCLLLFSDCSSVSFANSKDRGPTQPLSCHISRTHLRRHLHRNIETACGYTGGKDCLLLIAGAAAAAANRRPEAPLHSTIVPFRKRQESSALLLARKRSLDKANRQLRSWSPFGFRGNKVSSFANSVKSDHSLVRF